MAKHENSVKASRIPPYDEGAERGVLGAALMDAGRVMDLCIVHHITCDSFHLHPHRMVFEVMLDMHGKNQPIDLVTVGERLQALGRLEKVGGEGFLESMVIEMPVTAHAEYYIEIVRRKHLLRGIIERAGETIAACYSGEADADKVLGKAEESLFELGQDSQAASGPWATHIDSVVRDVNLLADGKMENPGVFTGFSELDGVLAGMQPGDMVVLAARPGMGKTALAMSIAGRVIVGNEGDFPPKPVAVFSLEMPVRALVARMLCARAGVRSQALRWGSFISETQHRALLEAASALKNTPLYIDDSGGLTITDLRSRARRVKRRHDVGLIIVDYLQLLKDPETARHGPQWEVASISNSLKTMAKELKIPVMVLSQLNRESERRENRRPRLADLRDSGAIEQDADVVMLLHRPCKYVEDPEHLDEKLAVVDIAKHRNGETREVRLNFIAEYTRFEDRDMPVAAPPAPAKPRARKMEMPGLELSPAGE